MRGFPDIENHRDLPLLPVVREKVEEALQDLRWTLLVHLDEQERLLMADPRAVMLAAKVPGYITYRTSYCGDLAFTAKYGGRVEEEWTFYREPSEYHGAHVWMGSETRLDIWGREWSRRIHGYFLMDDFGDLVEVPR
jgi:hypothetical protein